MIKRSMAAAAAIAVVALTSGDAVGFAQPGVWSPYANFVTIPETPGACSRVYSCGPASPQMFSADQQVAATSPKLVIGVCSTGGGGQIDECGVCLTNPPSEPCEWWLEQRQ